MLTRLGVPLAVLVLLGPIVFGLAGTLLPAFGYMPALGGVRPTLVHFSALFARPAIVSSALMSYVAGVATAAIALTLVMLFVAGWAGTRVFSRVQHLVSPLLSVPHAAVAFGLAFLIAPSGFVTRLLSPALTGWTRPPDVLIVHDTLGLSMLAGLVVKEIPFLLLITLAALPQVKLVESRALVASLGYGRIAGFALGLWPAVYRQVRFAVFAVIAFASSVVDVATILGPATPPPLAVRLVQWMQDPELSMRFLASAGALLQLAVTAAALATWLAMERLGRTLCTRMATAGFRFRRDRFLRAAALGAMVLAAAAVLGGLAVLGVWSFAGFWPFPDTLPRGFTLRAWTAAAPQVGKPLATTLVVAAVATLVAVVLAVLVLAREENGRARPRSLLLVYLPLMVPQAAFLFGLQLLFVLTGTVASLPALVLAHLVFVVPYVLLSLSDPWHAFDRRYEAVAAGLGKSRRTALLRVRLPMLTRAILTAAAVGFAVSIGQYLPTVLVGAGRLTTVTTEAVALASGGDRRAIGVYTFLQMVLPAVGFVVATLVPALVFRRFRAMRV